MIAAMPQNGDNDEPTAGLALPISGAESERRSDIFDDPLAFIQCLDLTPNGDRYIAAHPPLPLAERTVLGLLWMHRDQHGFEHRKVQFCLRDLVTKYIPDLFRPSRPLEQLLETVKEQLHRVARIRFSTENSYDQRLKRPAETNASVIDCISSDGDVLEVVWGQKFFELVQARV